MAYGMKYTKGGFPFKASPATYEKDPQAFANRKAQEKYNKSIPKRTSLDNPEHKGMSDEAYEAMMNDHDVNDDGVAETNPENYNKKVQIKKKK